VQVRVDNLYYLLCYAWNELDARSLVQVGQVDGQSPEKLFARVFVVAANQLLRRRLDRGYLEERDEMRRPRGKVLVAPTVGRGLSSRGFVECSADELTEDVVHNRLIKATALALLRLASIIGPHRSELVQIVRALSGVSTIRATPADFRRCQLHSNLRHYRFLLHVGELVHRCVLIDARSGAVTFQSFAGDEQAMGALFEAFLREFLKREQTTFGDVARRQVPWALEGDHAHLLPTMNTDIVLRRPGLRVVVEAKCYRNPTVARRSGGEALRSKDVYQLLSYVTNLKAAHPADDVQGVLVYAVDEERLPRAHFALQGRRIGVFPVNLNRPWSEIHACLLELVSVANASLSTAAAREQHVE
jgi:5-methylcytosine-specific restriction enzyme subunit McrC